MGDFFRAAVPIIFLIIWVISQVVGEQGKRAKPVKGPQQKPGGRRPPPKGVAQEIEEFLKRAAQQREGGKPAEVQVMRPEPIATDRGPRSAGQQAKGPPRQKPLEPAAVDRAVEVLPSRGDIAESVKQHLGGDRLGRHAEQLGDEIRDGDEEVQQRLHKTFDHQVGHLGAQPSKTPTRYSTTRAAPLAASTGGKATAELIELLLDPQGIRTAILVSEILKRPEHRW